MEVNWKQLKEEEVRWGRRWRSAFLNGGLNSLLLIQDECELNDSLDIWKDHRHSNLIRVYSLNSLLINSIHSHWLIYYSCNRFAIIILASVDDVGGGDKEVKGLILATIKPREDKLLAIILKFLHRRRRFCLVDRERVLNDNWPTGDWLTATQSLESGGRDTG